MWQVLRELALVDEGTRLTMAEVLSHLKSLAGSRASVLAITPSCDPAWVGSLLNLSGQGTAPAAVLLDAESFGLTGSDPSPTLEHKVRPLLARADIRTHLVRKGYPFPPRTPARRQGHWEFKTTPMGRAIVVRRPEDA